MDAQNKSVINIIQEMLQKGESEEKIFATLKEVGLSEDEIKNLLLISKSNTFTLLKSDIAKISKENVDRIMQTYKSELFNEIKNYNEKNLHESIKADIYEKQDRFEQKQIKYMENLSNVIASMKSSEKSLKDDIYALDDKLEKKAFGSVRHYKILRIISFILGIILVLLTAFKFITLGIGSSVEFLSIYIIITLAGVALLALSLM